MNPVMKPNLRLTSIWIQLGLIAAGLVFLGIEAEVSLILWSVLAYYQVGSAIYVRVRYKSEVGEGRWIYETTLAVLAMYMLTAFLSHPYSSLQNLSVGIFIYSLTGLSLVPKFIAIWRETQTVSAIALGIWVLLLLIMGVSSTMLSDSGGLMLIGFYLMAIAGPFMACFFLIIEYKEYRREMRARRHSPLDS